MFGTIYTPQKMLTSRLEPPIPIPAGGSLPDLYIYNYPKVHCGEIVNVNKLEVGVLSTNNGNKLFSISLS